MNNVIRSGGFFRSVRFLTSGFVAAISLLLSVRAGLALGLSAEFAAVFGCFVAFVVGFSLQQVWTFQNRSRAGRSLARYIILQFGLAAIAWVTGYFSGELFGTEEWRIAAGTTVVVGSVSLLGSFFWVFRLG